MFIIPEFNFDETEWNFYNSKVTNSNPLANVTSLERLYLQGETSTTEDDIQKLWINYLRQQGYGSFDLRQGWKQFLLDSGYDGHLYDQTVKYFTDNTGASYFSSYPSLGNGVTHYYKCDTNGSFPDFVGSSDGTITGATYNSSGLINGCYSFDSGSEYINLGTSLGVDGSSDYTISLWFYLSTSNIGKNVINNAAFGSNGINLYTDGTGDIRLVVDNGGTPVADIVGSVLSTSTWYHAIITFDNSASTITLYLDDSLVGSDSTSAYTSTTECRLGNGNPASGDLDGLIDEVGIWNRVLDSGERTALYNSGSGLAI